MAEGVKLEGNMLDFCLCSFYMLYGLSFPGCLLLLGYMGKIVQRVEKGLGE